MKNFEWKNEENNIDKNEQNMDTGTGADESDDDELVRRVMLTFVPEKLYMGAAWVQTFLCIYAAFAWLWQTKWAPFATFLFFTVCALEKIVTVVDLTLNPSVQVQKVHCDDDDGNDKNNDDHRREM